MGKRKKYSELTEEQKIRERAHKLAYHRTHRGKQADNNRRLRYGPNAVEHYEAQAALQGGCCAICGESVTHKKMCQDHDHACCPARKSCGSCLRALLCDHCNLGLRFMEKSGWPEKAAAYLAAWRSTGKTAEV
jgi:hypothetical protein